MLFLNNLIPIISSQKFKDEFSIVLKNKNLIYSLNILKNHIALKFVLLSCVSGIDLFYKNHRFCVVYDFLSLLYNNRIRVKVFLSEVCFIPTIIDLFINANWWEREVWDMYGIFFDNHPDLRRILTDYGFEGFPLKKDFPISGYIELRYDEIKKRVITESLELSQEFRNFKFETPWKN